jgi:hypothetical protein
VAEERETAELYASEAKSAHHTSDLPSIRQQDDSSVFKAAQIVAQYTEEEWLPSSSMMATSPYTTPYEAYFMSEVGLANLPAGIGLAPLGMRRSVISRASRNRVLNRTLQEDFGPNNLLPSPKLGEYQTTAREHPFGQTHANLSSLVNPTFPALSPAPAQAQAQAQAPASHREETSSLPPTWVRSFAGGELAIEILARS